MLTEQGFPWRQCENVNDRFISGWFQEYRSWHEYNSSEDSAILFVLLSFKPMYGAQSGGDTFVSKGLANLLPFIFECLCLFPFFAYLILHSSWKSCGNYKSRLSINCTR